MLESDNILGGGGKNFRTASRTQGTRAAELWISSRRHKHEPFATKQPPHLTGYQSSSVRPVCFSPLLPASCEEGRRKNAEWSQPFWSRNNIRSRLNKMATQSSQKVPHKGRRLVTRRIILFYPAKHIADLLQVWETIKTIPFDDSGSDCALNPVRSLLRPSGAFTGGSLPVNMCGPAAKTGCYWTTKHTPPQAPTAPPFPAKEGNATLEGCSIQNNDARMERKRDGRVDGRWKVGKRGYLGYMKKEILDQTDKLYSLT